MKGGVRGAAAALARRIESPRTGLRARLALELMRSAIRASAKVSRTASRIASVT